METPLSTNRTESAAEFVATVRKDHDVMMQWYNNNNHHNNNTISSSPAQEEELQQLREKYGPTYPESWKHVLNWNGWKDTRKVYIQHVQQSESSTTHQNVDTTGSVTHSTILPPTPTATAAAAVTTTINDTKNDTTTDKPKRKSRWGNVSATASTSTTTTAHVTTTTNNNGTNIDTSNGSGSKRGRWGTTAMETNETTTNNNHHQSELEQLRLQLRTLNYKMDHVVEEANRIDALPHNHRERSVSPPPSYVYIYICTNICFHIEWQDFRILTHRFICRDSYIFSFDCSLWTGWEASKYSCGTIQRTIHVRTSRFVGKDIGIDQSTTSEQWHCSVRNEWSTGELEQYRQSYWWWTRWTTTVP